jgi:phytoene dehydrogenase-like protein
VDEFLSHWFESDEVKVTLATDGVIGANGGPYTPGTAYVLLHHCMGMAAGRRGLWGYVRGGMGALSEAIAASARAHGAEIRVNAAVSRICVRDAAVCGVVLEDGEEIAAEMVASNLDPRATFLKLVDARDLPPEFVREMENYRCEGTSLKMNLALDGLPEFRALPGVPGPQHRATIHLCPSIGYVEAAWQDAQAGLPSRNPMLEIGIPSMYDPTLAPEGKHVMSVFLQYAPYTLRGATWDDLRDSYAERVLDVIEEYAPNMRSIIKHRQVLTPLDIEKRFGMTGGNIFHGELSADQLFSKRPKYRTPLPGLFLCGSGAHPGGGVMGAPGYNAARAMLKAACVRRSL